MKFRALRYTLLLIALFGITLLLRASLPTVATGTWVAAGNLSAARSGACTVVLSDGRLLISGGADASGPTATADLFSTTGSWSAAVSMNSARSHQSCAVLQDGRVLVAGGTTSGGGITNSAEIYDPSADSWAQAGVMNDARSGATVSVLQDGRVLIAGGQSSGGALNTLEIFDPNSGNFSNAGTTSSPRQDHAAAVLSDGRVIIIGGSSDGTNTLPTTDIYDPQAGSVSAGPAMSTPRAKHTATTLLDGTVVVIGGTNGTNDLASVEFFDPAANNFNAASSLATARSKHSAFLLPNNNEVLVVGGQSAGTDLASAELYIPWQKAFQATGAMATPRSDATGAALTKVDGRLLIAGGSSASAELYGFATVKTDAADYPPGTTVTITGSGWQPGETVTLTLVESPLIDTHGPFTTVADAFGNISNNSFVTDAHDLSIRFYLTASGSQAQAQNTFTDKTQPTTTITGENPASPLVVGQAVTVSVSVIGASSPTPAPTGTVSVTDGTVNCTVNLTQGTPGNPSVGSCSLTPTTAGAKTLTASYSGDTNYTKGTDATASYTVNKAGTTTSLTSSTNPSVSGQTATFTATVAAVSPGSGTATGTVTFKDGAATIGTGTLNGAGQATFSTSSLAVGSHSITAVYGGNTNFLTSTSAALSQTVNQASTTTTLTSSANPSVSGQSVTLTATVAAVSPGSGTATGTVTFKDGVTTLGTGTLNAGVATFASSTLAQGSHSITAVYGGDANFTGSTSSTLSQVVNQASTTTAVTSSSNPSVFGQSVTFTATVAAVSPGSGTATGTVTFKDGATTLGTGALSAGVATFATSSLAPGPHSITAVYGGDTNFTGSTSSALSQTVNQASTTTTLTSSVNPSVFGQSVTFTATVAAVAPGSGTATGTVTFKDGATTLGTGTLSAGVATFSSSSLSVAGSPHSITAVYGGDTNFATSTSPVLSQTVNHASTTTTLVSSISPSVSGQSVTFTATVAAVSPGSGTATGTVTFKDGATTLGTGTLSAGVATFSTSALSVSGSPHSVTAVYGGDTNFTGSTSSALSQAVNQASTTTTVTSSANPSVFGQSVTFTATVAAVSPGSGTATGTVTFKDGATTLGTGTLNAGVATFATSTLALGAHSITAVYGGDTNFTGSTSSTLSQVVNQASTTTTVTSSANPSVFGQGVTFTATVAAVAPGSGTATGTVTFKDGATTLGTGTLSAGQATFATSSLTVATHSITAVYGGDPNFVSSTSSALSQAVNQASTATSLTSSPNPSVFGQTVNFTVTVSAVAPGVGTPTGTVQLKMGPNNLGAPGTLSGGQATIAVSNLPVGANGGIKALYNGDTNFSASQTQVALVQNVNQASTSTSVVSSSSTSTYGQAVTFTATIAVVSPGAGTPTGTFTFNDGATTLGTGSVSTTGGVTTGTFTTTNTQFGAGTHSITAVYSGDASFNTSTSSALTQTVNKATVTATVAANNKVYDGTTAATQNTCTLSGVLAADSANVTCSAGTLNFVDKNVGTGKTVNVSGISLSGSAAGNYQLSSATATTTANITARPITVTAATNSKTYDGTTSAAPTPTITSGTLATGDNASFTESYASKNVGTGLTLIPAGSVSDGNGGNNYAVTLVNNTAGAITARAITVTAATNSKPYDGTTSAAAAPTITSGTLASGDTANFTESYSSANAGTGLTLVPSGSVNDSNAGNNYAVNFVNNTTGVITPVPITVTPDSGQSKVYGSTDPALTYKVTSGSLFTGDSLSGALSRVTSENVGTYTITQGTLTAGSNYNLAITAGVNFTITARPITVTPNSGQSKVYGNSDPVLTYAITSGSLVSGDSFSGALSRVAGESVGTYAITQGTLTAGTNYNLTFTSGVNFSITARPITVTADPQTKIYGNVDPALTYQITSGSLAAGDSFSGALTRVAGETVVGSPYAIQQGTLALNSNYTLTYVGAILTITPAPVAITVTDPHVSYDGNPHQATIGISPLVSVNVTYTESNVVVASPTNAGTYNVSVIVTDANYTGTGSGTLTISKATPTINWSNPADISYGTALSGTQLNATATFNNNPVPGTFTYNPAAGTVLPAGDAQPLATDFAPNDTTNFNSVLGTTVLINVKTDPLYIIASDNSRAFGQSNPTPTATFVGLVNGDTFSVTCSSPANSSSAPGTYLTSCSGTVSNNYSVHFINGTLTITNPLSAITAVKDKNGDASETLEIGQTDQLTATGNFADSTTRALSVAGGSSYKLQDLSTPVSGAAVAEAGGVLYAIGGFDGSNTLGTMQAYDPKTNTWSVASSQLTVARRDAAVASIAGKIYVIGGSDGSNPLGSIEVLDTTGVNLAVTPFGSSLSTARSSAGAAVLDHKLYVVGGSNGSAVSTVEIFDLVTGTSATNNVAGTAFDQTSAAVLNNQLYVLGVTGSSVNLINFDGTNWSSASSTSLDASKGVGLVAFNNALYAVNGDTVWAYNGSSFDQKNSLSNVHNASQPVAIGSLFYVASGTGTPSGKLDAFAPDELDWSSADATKATIDQSGNLTAAGRTDPGTVALTATSNFNNTISRDLLLTVLRKSQTITFGTLSPKTYGDADFNVSATASSGLAVIFAATGPCTVAANTVHITGAGSCTVTASQAGDAVTWAPAPDVPQTFIINKRNATWTTNPNNKTYGDPDPNPLTTGSGSNFVAADNVIAAYSRAPGETVAGGPYHITATLSSTVANALDNYIITNTGASFTINARPATWTTNANSKTYGNSDLNPLTTGSGDFLAADGVTATYSRAAGETVLGGPYHITATLAPAAVLTNYTITNTGASFTINARPATWTTNANSKTYGNSDLNPLTTGSGNFLVADGVTATYSRAAGETVAGSPYHITATLSSTVPNALNNYIITNAGADFTIKRALLTVSANPASSQYSDPLAPLTYTITGFVNGETTAVVSGSPIVSTTAMSTSAPGNYPITITLGTLAAANYTFTGFNASTYVITQEDARVTYAGNMFFGIPLSSTSAQITLIATIQDITAVTSDPAWDNYPGDIRNATVTFVNRDASNATLCTAPVLLVNSSDTKTGSVTCTFTGAVDNTGSKQYTVGIVVGGYYTDGGVNGNSSDNTVVTLSQVGAGMITGGGYTAMQNSAGTIAGDRGTKNNFGFNVKYNKGGTNLQGNINTIVRRKESDGIQHVYQIKGNSMTSLATSQGTYNATTNTWSWLSGCPNGATATSPCKAQFNGKANIQDVTNPLASFTVTGNNSLQFTMTDYGTPGSSDTIGITLWNGSGGNWFSTNWVGNPPATVEQLLGGGDLVVH